MTKRMHWPLGVLLLTPVLAMAHPGDAAHHAGFMAGFAHTFSGIDHVLVALGLGVWGALAGAPLARTSTLLVACYALAWWLGSSAGILTAVGLVAVVGAMLPTSHRIGRGSAALLAGAIGLFGFMHGLGLPTAASYAAGAGSSMLALFVSSALLTVALKPASPQPVP